MVISRLRIVGRQGLSLLAAGWLGLVCLTPGCSSLTGDKDYNEKPPVSSRVVRDSGETGGNFEYLANNPGQAYIFDANNKHILFNQHLSAGQNLKFDVTTGVVIVDGWTNPEPDFVAGHKYKLYWLDDGIAPPDKK